MVLDSKLPLLDSDFLVLDSELPLLDNKRLVRDSALLVRDSALMVLGGALSLVRAVSVHGAEIFTTAARTTEGLAHLVCCSQMIGQRVLAAEQLVTYRANVLKQ